MIVFPHCKINLGLHILSKREDHYHDLETVFLPLALHDMLEVIETGHGPFKINMGGIPVHMDAQENLCQKAYALLKKDFPQLPSIEMFLYKSIPAGAGLGGGSADAAFMLQLLNKKFNLQISHDKLAAYALSLGSDCPFFLMQQPCIATARGEKMQTIHLDLSAYYFVIIFPGIHVSTAWAFSQIIPKPNRVSLKHIMQQPVSTWKEQLVNDFEEPVFKTFLQLRGIKESLYDSGATYAAMSGSGSSVFGIFERAPSLPSYPSSYLVFKNLSQLVQ